MRFRVLALRVQLVSALHIDRRMWKPTLVLGVAVVMVGCVDEGEELSSTDELLRQNAFLPNGTPIRNASGLASTVSTAGKIDLGNEFFQDLGANGRRCVSCHLPTAGWTITPEQMQRIFDATDGGADDDGFGLGAAFRLNDGANSPRADVSTLEARRAAYSMLLTRGLIRVGIGIPADAEFELVAVDDPYGYASAAELSLFRRPLPTTNLKFLSAVMWDGRETFAGKSIHFDLSDQSSGATVGHAEGQPLPDAQRESIVAFELSLHTAQTHDNRASDLRANGAKGGPDLIRDQEFYIGINDNFGDSRTGAPFTSQVFTLYDAWATSSGSNKDRRAIARGQDLFNHHRINITGVSGLNDEAIFGTPAVVPGTCTTCHDAPNGGNHSVVAPLDLGLSDASRRTPDMPLYTLRNKATGELKQTTDPGRALISGKWKHIGRFKGPVLRALATRAPYFHNGSAATLTDVVELYNDRFSIKLTAQEKSDLIAFLSAL